MHSSRMHTAHSLAIVGGVSAQGRVPAQEGGVCPGKVCARWGGGCLGAVCLEQGGVPAQRGVGDASPGGGCLPRGVSCDLSHHAFDVTCMLPPHQLRLNTSAAASIVLTHCMLGYPPVNRMADRQV